MKTIEKIQKMTSRGQITIPSEWRKKINTQQIMLKANNNSIEIFPFYLPKSKSIQKECTVFDAIRDNQGRGLKAKDLLKILAKIDG